MKNIGIFLIFLISVQAGQYDKVKITPDIAYIYVYHKGKAVKVHRIQDTANKLTGEYAKQYRLNKDIQPIKINQEIQTIGEVELLQFMQTKGNNREGIVIDVRSRVAYQKESIPSAVNIPSEIKNNHAKMEKIIEVFGARRTKDGKLDTSHAKDLVIYCNGLWCGKSAAFIQVLLEMGYPSHKILYYRGGFQMWKILGFTTVTNK